MGRFSKRQLARHIERDDVLSAERDRVRKDPCAYIMSLLQRETPLSTKQIQERFVSLGITTGLNLRQRLKAMEDEQRIYHLTKHGDRFEMWYDGTRPGWQKDATT